MFRNSRAALPIVLMVTALMACGPLVTATETAIATSAVEPPIPSEAVAPSATPPLEPGVTPTDETAPSMPAGEPIAHLTPEEPLTITYVQMIDRVTGWAIGGPDVEGGHILRTADGGQTWADVTPPIPVAEELPSSPIQAGFFLDTERVWVASAWYPPEASAIAAVWATDDGGASWTVSTLSYPNSMGVNFLSFADATHGWLMVDLGAGLGHAYAALFRTEDGGASWILAIHPQSEGYADLSADLDYCCKNNLTFVDAQNGVLTFDVGPYTMPFVNWTRDGGHSWLRQDLPSPTGDPSFFDQTACGTSSPILFSPESAIVNVACSDFSDIEKESTFVYKTADGGQTWEILPSPGGSLLFLTPEVGFSLGRDIHKTTDGGQTWARLKTVNWDGQFSFVDQEHGWAVARSGEEIALVSTEDGGRTWQELVPELSP